MRIYFDKMWNDDRERGEAMDCSELYRMKHSDHKDWDKDSLSDIQMITADASLPPMERIENYLQQVKNPYHFKVNDIGVMLDWADTENTIQNQMTELIKATC